MYKKEIINEIVTFMSDITQISKINIKRRINQNIYDAHSPSERLSIKSTLKVWKYLKELIRKI